ncbi:hypothetical protein OG746_34600 [Streptomyces sp. NBC_01016]|uniref:hypothetical protein n=1 Tax=Streptomyces sp. NBC_01016 TaxID=2903720 RepID=UPI00225983A6|nr:hypothetical protein [Streptomyces sp. NBC_01016]MCX4833868.1 hypothetical protein [Streptomyces sp. NBC_01016]
MQSVKRSGRPGARGRQQAIAEPQPEGVEPDAFDAAGDEGDGYDTFEMYRVACPDCGKAIALLAEEDVLPEHAHVTSPWDPFGLTVCVGSGRTVTEALPTDDLVGTQEQATALLLTLPQGLDWRTQPFSHAGGAGSRPIRMPDQPYRRAAA